ncbi:class I SAM-dependent methyltransferase [Candidatus Micrarchaeota archaeon]|nr:class I SAM-dependent methyltransferase [Candidatus Micrarchaeota archaeon]
MSKDEIRRKFLESSINRFGNLNNKIAETYGKHPFVVEGNKKVAECLSFYLEEKCNEFEKKEKIRLLDAGCAIGALSSLIALEKMPLDLLEKTELFLLDPSQKVLSETIKGNFSLPVPSEQNESLYWKKLEKLKTKLSSAHSIVSSVTEIPKGDNFFDLSLMNFVFHHIPDFDKQKAAVELMRVSNGFIGVSDIFFDAWEEEHKARHQENGIPFAEEEIIPKEKLMAYFNGLKVIKEFEAEKYYSFCLEK